MGLEKYLHKLSGSRREPAGLEWRIWRSLPKWLLGGTLVPLLAYAYVALFPSPAPGESLEKYLATAGILAAATVVTAWTAVFTVAIGCFLVRVMKGPGYVADAYPLIDAEHPQRPEER